MFWQEIDKGGRSSARSCQDDEINRPHREGAYRRRRGSTPPRLSDYSLPGCCDLLHYRTEECRICGGRGGRSSIFCEQSFASERRKPRVVLGALFRSTTRLLMPFKGWRPTAPTRNRRNDSSQQRSLEFQNARALQPCATGRKAQGLGFPRFVGPLGAQAGVGSLVRTRQPNRGSLQKTSQPTMWRNHWLGRADLNCRSCSTPLRSVMHPSHPLFGNP